MLLTALAALALVPAAGQAEVMTLGSDLSQPANLIDAHGADSVWWNSFIGGKSQAVPVGGQVTFVRVKGSVLDDPDKPQRPDPQFHFNVIRPLGGGRVRVMLSTAPWRLPITYPQSASGAPARGDMQQIHGFKPVNLCVSPGDYVAFNDFGGFEWRWGGYPGMAVQVFSRVPDTISPFYTKNAGITNGAEFTPQATKQQEVLMQYKLSTGPDATDLCPGGFKQHIYSGLSVRKDSITVSARKGILKMHADCPYPSYGGCKGVLVLQSVLGGKPVTIGGAPVNVKPAYSASFEIKLSKKVVKKIKKAGGVTVKVTADTHDDPKSDKRANDGVPVQHKTTAGTIKVRVG
ncbi:MAG: hypothetical protein QOH38_1187 [Thermoleophilaceae bacterium]|nr:hypothetical protein [Thermoleophilaceae bacterium]